MKRGERVPAVSSAAIEHLVRKALLPGKSVPRIAGSPDFWPVVAKGGFENTLRDLMLADIQAASKVGRVCTGERGRRDIAIFHTSDIERRSFGDPVGVIELKLNYASMIGEALERVANVLHRSLSQPKRPEFIVVLIVCEIEKADAISTALLHRYKAAPGQKRIQTAPDRSDFVALAQKAMKRRDLPMAISRLASISVSDATGNNRGKLHFLSFKPRKTHSK
jgi:hypothetical protein